MFKKLLYFLTLTFILSFETDQPKIFIEDSFEDSDFLTKWAATEFSTPGALTQSDSVAMDGIYSLRVEVNRHWPGIIPSIVRSEVVGDVESSIHIERWYEFGIFLPPEWVSDSSYEIVFQLHDFPDFDSGEVFRSPALALLVNKTQWRVDIRSSSSPVNTNNTVDSAFFINIGPFQRNQWTKFKIHAKLAYDTTGILQIWKNDTLVINRIKRPNYYNDVRGPYAKAGIYKPEWTGDNPISIVDKRVLFIDSFRCKSHSGEPILSTKLFKY